MGVRLQSTTKNFYEDTVTIQIIDTGYGGTPVDFETYLEDSYFRFNGSPKDRNKRICTTELRFPLLVENQQHLDFYEDTAGQSEGRFFVKVYTDSEGDYGLRFAGHMVMDESFLQNKGTGQFIEIAAADGLYRLTDQDYKSDAEDQTNAYGNDIVYYEGFDTFLNIIYKCLDGLGTLDQYGGGDEFLWISQNWYEAGMSSLSGVTSLEWMRVNQRVFTQKTEDEEYLTMSRADVLKYILTTVNARISYVWGKYMIESINERGKSGRTFRKYDTSGNHLGNSTVSLSYTFDQSVKKRILAGGKEGRLPPIKQSCVTLSFTLGNYGYTPNYWSNDETSLISLGSVEVTSEETNIFFGVGISFYLTAIGVPTDALLNTTGSVWFGVKIKFGTYYYVTEVTQDTEFAGYDSNGDDVFVDIWTFENKWSSTEGTYLVYGGGTFDKLTRTFTDIKAEFYTDPLRHILDPDSPIYDLADVDELSVSLDHVQISGASPKYDYGTTYEADFDVVWQTIGFYAQPREGTASVLKTDSAVKYCYEHNVSNSNTIEEESIIGDVPFNSNNRIEVYDGADWIGSTGNWAVGSIPAADSGKQIQVLLLEELVRGQQSTIKRYIGTFEGLHDPTYLVKYDNITWVHSQLEYGLGRRRLKGDWYEYNYDALASFSFSSSGVKVDTSGVLNVASGDANVAEPQVTQIAYPIVIPGADSDTLDLTGIPLPDPAEVNVGQINYLVEIYRGSQRLWYGSGSNMYEFTINYAGEEIILGRALRTGEYVRGTIYQILE